METSGDESSWSSAFLVLEPESGALSLVSGAGSPRPLTALTQSFTREDFDLEDEFILSIWSGAGRYWFDSPAEMAINGKLIDGNCGRDRFWARAWYYSLGFWIFIATLLTAGNLVSLLLLSFYGSDEGFLGESLPFYFAPPILVALVMVQRLFLTRPIASFNISSPLIIVATIGLSVVGAEGFLDWLMSSGFWNALVVVFCLRCGISMNRLRKSCYELVPMRGPWISWDELPYEKPAGSPLVRWVLL